MGIMTRSQILSNRPHLMPRPDREKLGQWARDQESRQPAMDNHSLRTVTSQLPPKETDTRAEATTSTTSPYRAGKLVNNHHSHDAITTGIVPPPYAIIWRREHALDDRA